MKNVLPIFTMENGENLQSLNLDDYRIITYVIAVIYAYFQKFKAEHSVRPQEFFEESLDVSKNKRNALFILFEVIKSDPDKFFKPKEFRDRIKEYQQSRSFNYVDGVIVKLKDEMDMPRLVTSRDVEKSLRSLEKEFDIQNIQGKKEIRNLKGIHEKMTFLGKPSVERLGTTAIQIKKTLANEMALRFISESLRDLGIIESLSFLFEGSLTYKDQKSMSYDLVKMMDFHFGDSEQSLTRSEWEKYRQVLSTVDIQNIKRVSRIMAEAIIDDPLFILILLSIALQKKV